MNNHYPPYRILRFLKWFCPDHLYEEIEGDLIQRFHRDLSSGHSPRRAKRRFIWNTIRFFRPGIVLRNRFLFNNNPFVMLNHFFKIFFRTSLKNSGYFFINVSGLAAGLASSIFILLWVMDEVSFDDFHRDKERIFKVMSNHTFPDGIDTYDDTPGPLGPALKQLPEVEASCRIVPNDKVLLTYENKAFFEKAVYADSSIFKIFTIPLVLGSALTPDNNSIVISETLARKYFNDENPVGKVLRVNDIFDAKVKAVFKDIPSNATLEFDLIIPYGIYARSDQYNNEWGAWSGGQTFVKLYEGFNTKAVNDKIHKSFTKPNIWVRWDPGVELFLFPMTSWRLYGNFNNGKPEGGRITYVIGFCSVAIFILIIACVNFMNLATARSMNRAREIGIRKVAGAVRHSLTRQFIGESLLTSFISLFFALLLVHLLLPFFNTLTEKQMEIDHTNPLTLSLLIGITTITGLMAGSYPAFLLSSFKPVSVLKGTLSGLGGNGLRKALVVFQFSLSIILIICAIVIYKQIDFMKNKNLGFDRTSVFYFDSSERLRKNFDSFRNETLYNTAVKNVAQSNGNPMAIVTGMVLADNAWPGKPKEDNTLFKYLRCDYDLLPTLGFTFLEGRNFSRKFPSDSNNYILNEEAARRMKLADPIGQEIIAPKKGKIIGIVKDFHSSNFRDPIGPVIIACQPRAANRIFVRYEPGRLMEALKNIETVYKNIEHDFPFEPGFMDDTFGRQYKNEMIIGKLSKYFTAMAIFISCLGLFGLASFTAEKRKKEIGVRKVLGATVPGLISLLCKDFIQLIIIALIIGLPIAWWAAQKFLEEYAFHTAPGIGVFMITAMSAILVAILTVSYQSARAALANPVKSLRTE